MNIHKTQYASNAKGNTGVTLASIALGLAGANSIAPGGIVERVLGGKKCSCEGLRGPGGSGILERDSLGRDRIEDD